MVFVAARWPALVKEAVLLGARPEDAADATVDALSRCRRDWGRTSREGNVDALVQAELLLAVRRRPRTSEDGREQLARELLVLAPPTLQELEHQASVNNRASLRRAALVAVPLLLVGIGAAVYLETTRDDGKPAADDGVLENAAISQEANPAPGVVWYADGQLHLDHTVLSVEGLKDMTRIGTGVVYGDDEGRVVFAADDGSREVLGHKDPDVPVAATDETGWAAWVETTGDRPRLMIKEATTGNEVASAVVDAGAQVVAVDGGTVYYVDAAGAAPADPGRRPRHRVGQPARPPRRPLPDPRLPARRGHDPGRPVRLQRRSSSFRGRARSSPRTATSWRPGCRAPTEVALYDTRSGEALPTGVPEGDDVVTFAPGSRLTVTYVVAPAAQSPGGELELRTCELCVTAECAVAARIPDEGDDAGAGTLRAWETLHQFRQVDVFGSGPLHRQPGRGRPRRRRPRRRPDAAASRSGPTCPRRPSCCAPPRPTPTTGCGSSPPAASCRSPATRRSAARTPGSRQVVRRAATAVVQECAAGLVTIARAERLAFAAPPLLRDGPVSDRGPRPRSPGRCGSRATTSSTAKWCDNGPGWVGVLLEGRPRPSSTSGPTPPRSTDGHRRVGPVDRRTVRRRRRGAGVRQHASRTRSPAASTPASASGWPATACPSSTSPRRAPRSAEPAGCT